MKTGRSLKPLCDALRSIGVQFDVATIALDPGFSTNEESIKKYVLKPAEESLGAKIFYGQTENPGIYEENIKGSSLSGVHKFPGDLFSRATSSSEEGRAIEYARKDISIISKDLVQRYRA